jgi:hypothetical protein
MLWILHILTAVITGALRQYITRVRLKVEINGVQLADQVLCVVGECAAKSTTATHLK